jgi:hypothetical protein
MDASSPTRAPEPHGTAWNPGSAVHRRIGKQSSMGSACPPTHYPNANTPLIDVDSVYDLLLNCGEKCRTREVLADRNSLPANVRRMSISSIYTPSCLTEEGADNHMNGLSILPDILHHLPNLCRNLIRAGRSCLIIDRSVDLPYLQLGRLTLVYHRALHRDFA